MYNLQGQYIIRGITVNCRVSYTTAYTVIYSIASSCPYCPWEFQGHRARQAYYKSGIMSQNTSEPSLKRRK